MRLIVCISAHGYGHTAQTAVVLNALHARRPDVDLIIRSTVDEALLRARLEVPFERIPEATDFGMHMASAVSVRAAESCAAYADLHRDWPDRVAAEAARLRALGADAVLSNVPYLPLAGAARADLPAAALCSLHWAAIYPPYCGGDPMARQIHSQMLDAYRSAAAFLAPQPAMPMPELDRVMGIGPLARVGCSRRLEILTRYGLREPVRLVLVAPGGIPTRWPVEQWPVRDDLIWIVPQDWAAQHPQARPLEALAMSFVDVLASCDALLGKPGYGSVAECVCNGVPMLYVARGDWPEEPYLLDWLHRHGRGGAIDGAALAQGALLEPLRSLWRQPPPPALPPTGIEQAADWLANWLPTAR